MTLWQACPSFQIMFGRCFVQRARQSQVLCPRGVKHLAHGMWSPGETVLRNCACAKRQPQCVRHSVLSDSSNPHSTRCNHKVRLLTINLSDSTLLSMMPGSTASERMLAVASMCAAIAGGLVFATARLGRAGASCDLHGIPSQS